MANYDFTYTGAEIQAILDTGKKLKDSGYIFLGVATPRTNPGTPTQKVYYEAKQAGTYTNFGGVVLPDGISLLKWNGSWTSETVMCGDGGVFDISVYKSSGGTLATFADLAAALDGGNNIPASARKGGMSVKFVQSSDNKYVQCRLMSDTFTTDITQWVICDDLKTLTLDYSDWQYEGKFLEDQSAVGQSVIFGNSSIWRSFKIFVAKGNILYMHQIRKSVASHYINITSLDGITIEKIEKTGELETFSDYKYKATQDCYVVGSSRAVGYCVVKQFEPIDVAAIVKPICDKRELGFFDNGKYIFNEGILELVAEGKYIDNTGTLQDWASGNCYRIEPFEGCFKVTKNDASILGFIYNGSTYSSIQINTNYTITSNDVLYINLMYADEFEIEIEKYKLVDVDFLGLIGSLRYYNSSNWGISKAYRVLNKKVKILANFNVSIIDDYSRIYATNENVEWKKDGTSEKIIIGKFDSLNQETGLDYYEISLPESVEYIRFQYKTLEERIFIVDGLVDVKEAIFPYLNLENNFKGYILEDGIVLDVDTSPWNITKAYPVKTKTLNVLGIKTVSVLEDFRDIVFLSCTGQVVSTVKLSTTTSSFFRETLNVPNGACYFRFCIRDNDNYAVIEKREEYERNNYTSVQGMMSVVVNSGERQRIKLLGDSITHGMGGTGFAQNGDVILTYDGVTYRRNPNGYCWANLFKSYVEGKFNCTVVNNGIAGWTTEKMIPNLDKLIDYNDNIVYLMLGTNDRRFTKEQYETNLRTICEYILNGNRKLVLMSSLPAMVRDEDNTGVAPGGYTRIIHMEDIDNVVMKVAAYYNIEYISNYKFILEYCDYKNIQIDSLLADAVHPNDAGYDAMFKNIMNISGFGMKRPGATW